MSLGSRASLKVTIPLVLLGLAATLSAVNLLYHAPRAEFAVELAGRERMAQEMSRLQSTLEYLLLKGDTATAQHEVAVLSHNHDVAFAALADDQGDVIASTRRAWLGRPIADVLPAARLEGYREYRPGLGIEATDTGLLGHTRVLMGSERSELKPSRHGAVFLAYDLKANKAEARALVLQQSLIWAGWVTAVALVMWLVLHFLLTRRTARLVHAAEEIAAGNHAARSGLRGPDELGRLGRAFDAMALEVAETNRRLRQDLEARVRIQRELENSEARLQQILDNATAVVSVKDTEGRFLFVNREWERVFRLRQADVVGRTEEECLPQDVARPHHANDRLVLDANAPMEFEETARLDDGTHTYISIKFPLHDAGGRAYAVCGISTDVTERKRSAEELARQRESIYQREKLAALGSLLAGVSHELNNPLSVVVARAVLLEEHGEPATQAAAVKIRTAAERCARIVRTFLAMARQQRPERGPVDIREVVDAALDIAAYALRTSGVEVEVDCPSDLPRVLADADQLHQVMLNLLINAQQALQDRPLPRRIRVAGRFDVGRRVLAVTVSDNGPGVPSSLRARVFEPFFTTKPTGVGTGVGLAVSLGIVEAHGGTLTVDASPEGGAEFTVSLPAGDVVAAERAAGPAPKASAAKRSILIVDDEPDIRDALAEILGGARGRVVTAASGSEALDRLAEESFDAILTDVRMPDRDGRDLYEEIVRRWPGRAERVVFVTGDTLATSLRDFVRSTGRPVIEKPFLPGEVRRVVAELSTAGGSTPAD